MDFPKSVPNIGLVGGKFVDENQLAGTPGSLIPSAWGNAVTDELLAVIVAGGLVPDETDNTQLAVALQRGRTLYAPDTGAANVYVAAFKPAVVALVDGMVLKFKAKTANTGACTFNPNGLGAKAIVGGAHGALQGGELVANGDVWLQYNSSIGGGSWVLIASTGGALPVGVGSKSLHAMQAAQIQAGAGLYGADTAAGNVYAVAYAPVITALTDGMQLRFKAKTANTGASTFAPNGLAAKAIVGLAQTPLQGGEIVVDGMCTVVYSLAQDKWVLTSCSGGDLQVAPATQSQHAMQFGQAVGRLLNVQVFDPVGAATYTPTPGATTAFVDVQGAGGQGGGSPACAAGQNGFGTGGHSGARAVVQISLAGVTTVPVTIGAGGSSGAAGASGQTGQTTSFGTYVSCPGGAGGNVLGPTTSSFIGANAVSLPVPTIGGVLKTIMSQTGNSGPAAMCMSVGIAISGSGGISPGYGGAITGVGGTGTGNPGSQVGSGGTGAFTAAGGAAQIGGLGIRGKIVVYDYT